MQQYINSKNYKIIIIQFLIEMRKLRYRLAKLKLTQKLFILTSNPAKNKI